MLFVCLDGITTMRIIAMKLSETQAWIKKCEGLKMFPYSDTTGHMTIAWGRNLENGLSIDEAELMFQNDYRRVMDELLTCGWFTIQPPGVQAALINMNFNLGINKLEEFVEMIAALKVKNYARASEAALKSKWALEVKQRAVDIAVMIREGK